MINVTQLHISCEINTTIIDLLLFQKWFISINEYSAVDRVSRLNLQRSITREASWRFGITYNKFTGTLCTKFKGKPGCSTVLTNQKELATLRLAAKCSDWGFLLNLMAIRMMVKIFFDRKGKTVNMFTNNVPGVDWHIYSFLNRHKKWVAQRSATNITFFFSG